MYKTVQNFLSNVLPPLPQQTKHEVPVTTLIVPADGSPPRLNRLMTVNVSSDGNVDHLLHHIPDMRSFWGSGDGWEFRDIKRIDIGNQENPSLNGCYFGFKSFALEELPINKHTKLGICGDACIVKMAPERHGLRGARIVRIAGKDVEDHRNAWARYAVYDDLTEDVIESGLWKELVMTLATD